MLDTIIMILVIVVAAAVLIAGLYVYLRDRSLVEIQADVYQLFLKAEHNFKYTGAGKQKMKWVVSRARGLLPEWLQLIVTEEFLHTVIQLWFDAVKDLLDDGKYNKSVEAEQDE